MKGQQSLARRGQSLERGTGHHLLEQHGRRKLATEEPEVIRPLNLTEGVSEDT